MPIEKVLITHKFGIISQSHKRLLQERLVKQRILIENESIKLQKQNRNDDLINLQINEDFVKEYNESTVEKKAKLNQQCNKIYEKLKKKLINSNSIDDLNIQLCWAELSQLMQCSSPIQEECMDLFMISMLNSKLSASQIPTLFFLAETIIYWIRTDTINQPFLRAFEIKLLKVGKLIFERIYFHMIENSLNEKQQDLKEHLSIYLQGFNELKSAYSPYPDAYLYIEYMIHIGELITTLDNDKTKSELDTKFKNLFLTNSIDLFMTLNNFKQKNDSIEMIFNNFLDSNLDFYQNNWLDCSIAFKIIAECSKTNLKALNLFLNLSKTDDEEQYDYKNGLINWNCELACVYVELLSDICIYGSSSSIRRKALLGFNSDPADVFKNKKNSLTIYGLLDCANFQLNHIEWSWMIRYLAIKGMVKICKLLNEKENEEYRQLCWTCLVILQESEHNLNVLEALKVGQVNSKIDNIKSANKNNISVSSRIDLKQNYGVNIYCQMAIKLNELKNKKNEIKQSNIVLNDYDDDVLNLDAYKSKSDLDRQKNEKKIDSSLTFNKKRTTLKDEMLINDQFETKIPKYYERKNFDLMRIVEDQFRKEEKKNFEKTISNK